jgi:hypothetical protein
MEGNNNLSKAGSPKGVFSSFYISGVSVTVAHPTSSWEEGGSTFYRSK